MVFSSALMEKTAAVVAQQNAMEREGVFLAHGSRLFFVEEGWESRTIMKDEGVRTCDTLLSFEEAVRDPAVQVIFLPADAAVTEQSIEKICFRNGSTKTIFKEVKKS